MRHTVPVVGLILAGIFVLIAGLIGWMIYDHYEHQVDVMEQVLEKGSYYSTQTTCSTQPGTEVQTCRTSTTRHYEATLSNSGHITLSAKQYRTLHEGTWYNMRICGKTFPSICEVYGVATGR